MPLTPEGYWVEGVHRTPGGVLETALSGMSSANAYEAKRRKESAVLYEVLSELQKLGPEAEALVSAPETQEAIGRLGIDPATVRRMARESPEARYRQALAENPQWDTDEALSHGARIGVISPQQLATTGARLESAGVRKQKARDDFFTKRSADLEKWYPPAEAGRMAAMEYKARYGKEDPEGAAQLEGIAEQKATGYGALRQGRIDLTAAKTGEATERTKDLQLTRNARINKLMAETEKSKAQANKAKTGGAGKVTDPAKIKDKIAFHQANIARLNAKRGDWDFEDEDLDTAINAEKEAIAAWQALLPSAAAPVTGAPAPAAAPAATTKGTFNPATGVVEAR